MSNDYLSKTVDQSVICRVSVGKIRLDGFVRLLAVADPEIMKGGRRTVQS